MEKKDIFSDRKEEIFNREKTVDQILNRGVIVNVLPDKESFRQRLISQKPMKIYIGADPTSTALHLSHAKNYMLLEEFRRLGHEVTVLFGDFTARIGDPTGNINTRGQLTKEQVMKNVKGWIKQIKPLMDFEASINPPKIVYNSGWLSKLTMEDVINLSSNFTVQRMLERDMFEERIKKEKPIFLNEFMYPLMQGYDSVALGVDAELCGTDQTFNALVGRTMLKKFKHKEKFVVAVNLMENPVTGELMSKSRGTGVFLDFDPSNMYGAIMSHPDEMIRVFLINNTRIPLDEIDSILQMKNLRDAKMLTAFEITKVFYGEEKANEAQNNFIRLVQRKESTESVPQIIIDNESIPLQELLKKCIPEASNSRIRRLLDQNAIKIDGITANDSKSIIKVTKDGLNVKIGKKKWFKIISR